MHRHMTLNSATLIGLDQALRCGAEGSRTLTGTDLNLVPLPIGLRPRRRFRGADHPTCANPISFSTRATWPVAFTFRHAFSMLPSGPMTNVDRMTPITVRP